jgi:CRP-like cAMP-binding protein
MHGRVETRDGGPSLRAIPLSATEGGPRLRRLLTPRQQKILWAAATLITFDARQVVFRAGTAASAIYICSRGILKSFRDLPSGKRRILAFIFQDDAFGLAENGLYVNSTQALVKSTCYRIPVDALLTILQHNGALGWQFICKVAHELRESQRRTLVIGRRSAPGRVAMLLKMLESRAVESTPDVIDLPMSRSDVAEFLGLSLESVSRATARLTHHQIIAFNGPHQVRVLNRQALDRLAGDL